MLLEGVEARATYFDAKERRDLLRVFHLDVPAWSCVKRSANFSGLDPGSYHTPD